MAAATPTSRAPIRPGRTVTATPRNIIQARAGIRECFLYYTIQTFEVGAGGDFGDDAAVAGVLGLGVDDV